MLSVVMLVVTFSFCHTVCYYAESTYFECHSAEYNSAECVIKVVIFFVAILKVFTSRNTFCCWYTERHQANCRYAACRIFLLLYGVSLCCV
jgi:hypothetical protein